MKLNITRRDNIIEQLDDQGFTYELLTKEDLVIIEKEWKEKYYNNNLASDIGKIKWHIFSYRIQKSLEGKDAIIEYEKQFPTDLIIFNDSLDYGILCKRGGKLPIIKQGVNLDDIYISQYSMKWTFVRTHEEPFIGPYFHAL